MASACPPELLAWVEALAAIGRGRYREEANKRACGPWSFEFSHDRWVVSTNGQAILFARCETEYPEIEGQARRLLVDTWMTKALSDTKLAYGTKPRDLAGSVRYAQKENAYLRLLVPGTDRNAYYKPEVFANALRNGSKWLQAAKNLTIRVADGRALAKNRDSDERADCAFVNGPGWGLMVMPFDPGGDPNPRILIVDLGRPPRAAAA